MALRKEKSKAIELRKLGYSYSQIKEELHVSKSSLSLWLRDMPLPEERIRELRDTSSIRIERTRETKRKKKQNRLDELDKKVAAEIGALTEREIMIAGLFLYWGEGSKTSPMCTSLSNTDPSVLLFFIKWLEVLGVPKNRLKVHVHLYSDMEIEKELEYWSATLGIPRTSFRKPYIKESRRSQLTYKQKFIHGTCNVLFDNRDICEYVYAGLNHLRFQYIATIDEV